MFALQFERCLAPSGPKLPILLNTAVYGHKPAKQINAWIVTVRTDWNRSPRNLLFLNPGSKCRRHPQIEGPHRGINSRFTPCCYFWMNKWLATSMLIRWTYMARLKNIRSTSWPSWSTCIPVWLEHILAGSIRRETPDRNTTGRAFQHICPRGISLPFFLSLLISRFLRLFTSTTFLAVILPLLHFILTFYLSLPPPCLPLVLFFFLPLGFRDSVKTDVRLFKRRRERRIHQQTVASSHRLKCVRLRA